MMCGEVESEPPGALSPFCGCPGVAGGHFALAGEGPATRGAQPARAALESRAS